MPVFRDGEDIENYLLRFERLAKTWLWPVEEWAYRLVPLLTAKALEAYTGMDEELSNSYPDLREALLEKFDISEETYRRRFRGTTVPAGETPKETYHRLKGLYRRWMKPETRSKEQIGEIVILEQLFRVLPGDIRTWVQEHEPTNGLEAAQLAQQYLNARRGIARSSQASLRESRPARVHASPSHFEQGQDQSVMPAVGQKETPQRKGTLICFYCGQQGHKASVCPLKKPKLSSLCYVPREGNVSSLMVGESVSSHISGRIDKDSSDCIELTSKPGRTNVVKHVIHLKDDTPIRQRPYRFATLAAPLTELTLKSGKNPVHWTENCKKAFQALKDVLCSEPVLVSPDFNKPFTVQVDASAVGIGAVLVQGVKGEERPVLYLSRKLLPREMRYSTVEKEALAIKWALESLQYYLLGREFILETDQRSLG
ncbi:zinc finger and SCAN domain-containing protein 12 [Astyanax mexicanus]|uniref:zinc finger and SCAN domain-containing protein 12 n=1 Tax=Astyanax mexicanus TaxID=7994 RepID=UPI0020CADAE1|nr:zinc finger and SCAN domain-containing protein 12 [Astyanax mexicanus]